MKSQIPDNRSESTMNRREFISSTAATAATISVIPRHVLGGPGYTPPSDKITVANIGCGTQGLRELPGMLENPDVQVVSVCDPNKLTTDYLDWSPHGIRDLIRRTLEDPKRRSSQSTRPGSERTSLTSTVGAAGGRRPATGSPARSPNIRWRAGTPSMATNRLMPGNTMVGDQPIGLWWPAIFRRPERRESLPKEACDTATPFSHSATSGDTRI